VKGREFSAHWRDAHATMGDNSKEFIPTANAASTVYSHVLALLRKVWK